MKNVCHKLLAVLTACLVFVTLFGCTTPAFASDIPLKDSVVKAARELCKEYGIDPALLWAIIEVESNFNVNDANSNCKGLMQVHKSYAGSYAKRAGMSSYDLFDPIDNIHIGLEMLKEHIDKYGDTEDALIAYNNGDGGAQSYFRKGTHSTSYSRKVVKARAKWAAVEAAETKPIEDPKPVVDPKPDDPVPPKEPDPPVVIEPEPEPVITVEPVEDDLANIIIVLPSELTSKIPEIHFIRLRDLLL